MSLILAMVKRFYKDYKDLQIVIFLLLKSSVTLCSGGGWPWRMKMKKKIVML